MLLVVGIPGLFWGAKTQHCSGSTCDGSKLKPSLGCNQRNQADLKVLQFLYLENAHSSPGRPGSYPQQAGASYLVSLIPSEAACSPFVLLSWLHGDPLNQLLDQTHSAVIFFSYSP